MSIKKLIQQILRILFLPMSVLCLLGTAILNIMSSDPNWPHWREYNAFMIDVLPFGIGSLLK